MRIGALGIGLGSLLARAMAMIPDVRLSEAPPCHRRYTGVATYARAIRKGRASRYMPHQGKREIMRRTAQMMRGPDVLTAHNPGATLRAANGVVVS